MEKHKNWFHAHPVLTTIIVIFTLLLIAAVITPSRETSPSSPVSPSQINPPAIPSVTSATWHEVVNFTGVGVKNTDSFAIRGSKFKLAYTVVPDNSYSIFTFFMYPEGETEMYEEYVSLDSGTDETVSFAGPGNYYLTVNAGNVRSWKISVYDYY